MAKARTISKIVTMGPHSTALRFAGVFQPARYAKNWRHIPQLITRVIPTVLLTLTWKMRNKGGPTPEKKPWWTTSSLTQLDICGGKWGRNFQRFWERKKRKKQLAVANGSNSFRTQSLGTVHIPAKRNNDRLHFLGHDDSWLHRACHARPCADTLLHSFWKFRLILACGEWTPTKKNIDAPALKSLKLEPLWTRCVWKKN